MSVDLGTRLHVLSLHAAIEEWEVYITHLRRILQELVGRLALDIHSKLCDGDIGDNWSTFGCIFSC
jgi:hypothetical protein